MKRLYRITVLCDGAPLPARERLTSTFTHIVDLDDPVMAEATLLELLAGSILHNGDQLKEVWRYALVLRAHGEVEPTLPEFRATYPQVAALGVGK